MLARYKVPYLMFFLAMFLLPSCSAQSVDYDRLCAIYGGVSVNDDNYLEVSLDISGAIEREVPGFVEDYDHILNASASEQYELTRQVVKARTGRDWHCEAMKEYLEWRVSPK